MEIFDAALSRELSEHFSAMETRCRPITLAQLNSRPVAARLRDAAAALFAPYL